MELTTKPKLLSTGSKAQGWPHGLSQLSSAQLQPHRPPSRSPKCVFLHLLFPLLGTPFPRLRACWRLISSVAFPGHGPASVALVMLGLVPLFSFLHGTYRIRDCPVYVLFAP